MSWDPSLSTGIDVIDFQHMELVKSAEEFAETCSKGLSQDYINKTLNFLEDYVIEHFSTEEKLQQECDFPEYDGHKRCHEYFIQDFTDFKNRIDEFGISKELIHELNGFLLEWIMDHIAQKDLVFAAHYKAVHPDLEMSGI